MFNDERINAECGRIYPRGILLAVLETLVYVAMRSVTLAIRGSLTTVVTYTETVILLVGIGILVIGAVRFGRGGDERVEFERHAYYLKAGRAFVVAALSAYILTIPFTTRSMLGMQAHNHLLILLEVLGCLYLFYAFKARDISFNYSFIDECVGHYYVRVLIIIGKLWLWLLPMFVLAATWEAVLHRSWVGALAILFAYVSSAAGLSMWYFFVSLVEKLSYDSPQDGRPAKGARVAVLVCLWAELLAGVLQCVYAYIATHLGTAMNTGVTLASVSLAKNQVVYLRAVLLGIAICQILPQLRRGTRLVAICRVDMLLLLALSSAWTTLSPLLYSAFSEQLLRTVAVDVAPVMAVIVAAARLALWVLSVYAMTRDAGLPRALWAIPAAQLAMELVGWFLNSQSLLMVEPYCRCAVGLGCAIFLAVVICRGHGFACAEE